MWIRTPSELRLGLWVCVALAAASVGVSGAPDNRRDEGRPKSNIADEDDAEGGDEGAQEDE